MEEKAQWSQGLQAETREALEELDLIRICGYTIAMKHIGNEGSGMIGVDDVRTGRLRLVNRRTEVVTDFASADEVLAAGWAVD